MRYCGVIGYGIPQESAPGVWEDDITDVQYFGDVLQALRRLEDGEGVNNNIVVGNRISIVADQFANEHYHQIRYAEWAGARWTVTSVEVKSPRLILSLGSVYNGRTD